MPRGTRSLMNLVLGAALGACSPAATSAPTTQPTTAPAATTNAATTAPASAAPQGTPVAAVAKTRQVLIAGTDPSGKMTSAYQVIVELKNSGPDWATLAPFAERLTIKRPDGSQVLTAQFTFAYPDTVAAGGFGYLIDNGTDPSPVADLATLEITGVGSYALARAIAVPGATFEVSDIVWVADAKSGGLNATGNVTTTSSKPVPYAIVAVLCIGPDGSILGATTTHDPIANPAIGAKTAFTTDVPTPRLIASACASSIGVAAVYTPAGGGD